MRFALTAQALARDIMLKRQPNYRTKTDLLKVMRYRGSENETNISADVHWNNLLGAKRSLSTDTAPPAQDKAHRDLQAMVQTFMDLEVSGVVEGPKSKALRQSALAQERAKRRGTRPSDELAAMQEQAARRKMAGPAGSEAIDDSKDAIELPEDFDDEHPLKLWSEFDEQKGGRAEQGVGKRQMRRVHRGISNYIGSKGQFNRERQDAGYRARS